MKKKISTFNLFFFVNNSELTCPSVFLARLGQKNVWPEMEKKCLVKIENEKLRERKIFF